MDMNHISRKPCSFPENSDRLCVDVNECYSDPDACGRGECVNTEGSYECDCHHGYALDDAMKCVDVNECVEGKCVNGTCVNEDGGFSCECPEGFR